MSTRSGGQPNQTRSSSAYTTVVTSCSCGQEIETSHREHCSRCGVLLAVARAA